MSEIEQKLRISKTDSTRMATYVTDGAGPATAVPKDRSAMYLSSTCELRGSASNFYHADSLGSTRGITDSIQVVTDSHLYDAFGNTVI